FDARAVAESTKTASWRYMMGALPLQMLADADADAAFLAELDEIRQARPGIDVHLSGRTPQVKAISELMRRVRTSDLTTRKATYLQDRIRDQRDWYSAKGAWNKQWKTYWYWASIGLQTLALILAILSAVYGPFAINVVGVLMTVVASATAWSQA